MAVSALTIIDISNNQFHEILEILIKNSHNINNTYKYASLLTLEFICESLDFPFLSENQANSILTALISNLTVPELELREVALRAFRNSAKFYQQNFANASECSMILIEICNNFQEFPVLCLQILCEIEIVWPESFSVSFKLIRDVTFAGINSANDEISIIALEV